MPSTEPTDTLSHIPGAPSLDPFYSPQTKDSEQQLRRQQKSPPRLSSLGGFLGAVLAAAVDSCVKDTQHCFPHLNSALWDAGRNHVWEIAQTLLDHGKKGQQACLRFKGAGRWLGPWGTQSRGSFWPLRKLPGP